MKSCCDPMLHIPTIVTCGTCQNSVRKQATRVNKRAGFLLSKTLGLLPLCLMEALLFWHGYARKAKMADCCLSERITLRCQMVHPELCESDECCSNSGALLAVFQNLTSRLSSQRPDSLDSSMMVKRCLVHQI